jgi:hypothetical protein
MRKRAEWDARYNRSEKGRARSAAYARRRYEQDKAEHVCAKTGCRESADYGAYCFYHRRLLNHYTAEHRIFHGY